MAIEAGSRIPALIWLNVLGLLSSVEFRKEFVEFLLNI